MSISASSSTTVTSSATLIGTQIVSQYGTEDAKLLRNTSASVTVYLGGADVSTSNGFPLQAGETLTLPAGPTTIYGRTASSTADVRVLR